MAAAVLVVFPGEPVSSPSLLSNPIHPSLIQRPLDVDTPSGGKLAKEPLRFLVIEPAVHNVFPRIRILFLENEFFI